MTAMSLPVSTSVSSPEKKPVDQSLSLLKRFRLGIEAGLFVDTPLTLSVLKLMEKTGLALSQVKGYFSLSSRASFFENIREKNDFRRWFTIANILQARTDPNFKKTWDFYYPKNKAADAYRDSQDFREGALDTVTSPIFEELLFRGGIQDILLKRLPQAVLKRVAPEKLWVLDTKIAQVSRIIFTASLFSAAQLLKFRHGSYGSIEPTRMELASALVANLVLGAIKESELGLAGAIGSHMIRNAIFFTMAWTDANAWIEPRVPECQTA